MFKKINPLLFYFGCLGSFYYLNKIIEKEEYLKEKEMKLYKKESKSSLNLRQIFQLNNLILGNYDKKHLHLSIPFNRSVAKIYKLDHFYYIDYENYNFNKLSDFFLNIHIFIN